MEDAHGTDVSREDAWYWFYQGFASTGRTKNYDDLKDRAVGNFVVFDYFEEVWDSHDGHPSEYQEYWGDPAAVYRLRELEDRGMGTRQAEEQMKEEFGYE